MGTTLRLGAGAVGPVAIVTLINILSAAVALAKDMGMAAYFGTGSEADAFYLAFFVADAVGSNLLSSALVLAVTVVFTNLDQEQRRLWPAVVQVSYGGLALSTLLGSVLWALRSSIIALLGLGAPPAVLGWARPLYLMFLPVVILLPVTAILSGLLQATRHFAWAALLPVLTNAIWMVAVVMCQLIPMPLAIGTQAVAGSVVGAAAITCLIALLLARHALRDEGSRPAPSRLMASWQEVGAQATPLVLLNLSGQIVLFVERSLASTAGEGMVAALSYAFRFAQLPLWTFILALNTVFLPRLVEQSAVDQLQPLVRRMLRLGVLLTLPASLVLWFLRVPIVAIVLKRGSFDYRSLALTADLLGSYALAIIPMGLAASCQRLLAARRKLLPALIGGIAGAILTLFLDVLLLHHLGPVGLGYGAAVGAWLNALLLLSVLHRAKIVSLPAEMIGWSRALIGHLPLAATLAGCGYLWPVLGSLSRFRIPAWVGLAAPLTLVAWLACLKLSGGLGLTLAKEGDGHHA